MSAAPASVRVLLGTVVLVAALPARAARSPAFTDFAQTLCQREIGRNATKLYDDALKAWAKCYDGEGKGRGDCVAVDLSAKEPRLRRKIERRCGATGGFAALAVGPSPAEAVDLLVAFVLEKARQTAAFVYHRTYGGGDTPVLGTDPGLFKCLSTLGREAGRLAKKRGQYNTRCLDDDDRQQVTDPAGPPACDEAGRADKLATAGTKAASAIAARCPTQLAAATGWSAPVRVVETIAAIADGAVCDFYPRAGNADVCPPRPIAIPARLRRLATTANFGWKGPGHGAVATASLVGLDVEARNCSGAHRKTCELFAPQPAGPVSIAPRGEEPDVQAMLTSYTTDVTGDVTFTGNFDQVDFLSLTVGQETKVDRVFFRSDFPTCSGTEAAGFFCDGGADDGQPCVPEAVYPDIGTVSPDCRPTPGNPVGWIRPGTVTRSTAPSSFPAAEPCDLTVPFACHCAGQLVPNLCPDLVCPASGICSDGVTRCHPDPLTGPGSAAPTTLFGAGCLAQGGLPIDLVDGFPGAWAITTQVELDTVVEGSIEYRTLGGRLDIGWDGSRHAQAVPPTLFRRVFLVDCVGADPTTCSFSEATDGAIESIALTEVYGFPLALVTYYTSDQSGSITFGGPLRPGPVAIQSFSLEGTLRTDIKSVSTYPVCTGASLGDAGVCAGSTAAAGMPCVVEAEHPPFGNTSPACPPIGGYLGSIYPPVEPRDTATSTLVASEPCELPIPGCHCPNQFLPDMCVVNEETCVPSGLDGACSTSGTPCFLGTIARVGSTSPLVLARVGCGDGYGVATGWPNPPGLPGPIASTLEIDVVAVP